MKELYQMIEKATVVSFDIFDTLIIRHYDEPTDLFLHLEESLGLSGFKSARIMAEASCREEAFEKGVHEITLDQIYRKMHTSYQIQDKEVELELMSCTVNHEMKKIYDFAVMSGKKVCISSDMYLPQQIIEAILKNNGYSGYDEIFVSSTTKRPKVTGEMYEDIIQKYSNVPPESIIHIGDNIQTDYLKPREYGIQAYCYDSPKQLCGNKNSGYFALLSKYAKGEVSASLLKGLITKRNNRFADIDYWHDFAYKYAGIIAVGYCQWLKEQFDKKGITKAFFMLRDGYIIKRVFDAMYPGFDTREVYGSRRMYFFTRMKTYDDIKPYIDLMMEGVTYETLLERLMIDDQEFLKRYLNSFPHQKELVLDVHAVEAFMRKNEGLLLDIAKRERADIHDYLKQSGVLSGKCAVVDLGWRCSMLKGINAAAEYSHETSDVYGYYLGTHPFTGNGLRVSAYGINNGKPTDSQSPLSSMNSAYVVDILELCFTAPYPSTLNIRKNHDGFEPIYQTVTEQEQKRIYLASIFEEGILDFVKDYLEASARYPVSIPAEIALLPMKYFETCVSPLDRKMLASVSVLPGFGNDRTSFPLTYNGRTSIGIVNPWPGDVSGEMEAIARIKRAIKENGYIPICIDASGQELDENQRGTGRYIDAKRLDFVITTTYDTPKLLDAFYYHALWNPPEIPLKLDYYVGGVTNNLLMNDDYLIYDFGGMSNHLRSVLTNKPRTLEGASYLTASLPVSAMLRPNLDNARLFYCGMNWEKATKEPNRHEGLFSLLDQTGKVEFYGPEVVAAWGGLRPWDGYRSYKGSIPFDGFSILKNINDCGICLVLSSTAHRRAGAVTNRAYEACAAGAVMISDNNPFMQRYFADAALFIDYNENDPRDTFRQIMEKYEWIISHRDQAIRLVERAQKIFTERFSLDVQIRNIVNRTAERETQIEKDLFSKKSDGRVLVTYVFNSQALGHVDEYLSHVVENINNQIYPYIELAICADNTMYSVVKEYCANRCARARVIPIELFDSKGVKRLTDGQAIRFLQKIVPHEYFMNMNSKEIWFSDHVTTLIRTIEDEGSLGACSGSAIGGEYGAMRIRWFNSVKNTDLYNEIMDSRSFPVPGQFIFCASAHKYLPDYLFDCLDGKEHYAYAGILQIKLKKQISFSKRMTHRVITAGYDNRNIMLEDNKQSRFIQDLVHFYIDETHVTENKTIHVTENKMEYESMRRTIGDLMLHIPLKSYIKLRYYSIRMRKLNPTSRKYKKLERKNAEILERYNSYWGG